MESSKRRPKLGVSVLTLLRMKNSEKSTICTMSEYSSSKTQVRSSRPTTWARIVWILLRIYSFVIS